MFRRTSVVDPEQQVKYWMFLGTSGLVDAGQSRVISGQASGNTGDDEGS